MRPSGARHLMLAAALVLAVTCANSVAQRKTRPPRTVPPQASETPPGVTPGPQIDPAIEPFDVGRVSLPAGYAGADPERLYAALAERKRAERKDEYETTEQHRQRIALLKDAPLVGAVRPSSTVALILPHDSASFDADSRQMAVKIRLYGGDEGVWLKTVERGRRTYRAQNAFGAAFDVVETTEDVYAALLSNQRDFVDDARTAAESLRGVAKESYASITFAADAATAKRLKGDLRALAVVRLVPPFTSGWFRNKEATLASPSAYRRKVNSLQCELLELWLFDDRSGEVLARRKRPAG